MSWAPFPIGQASVLLDGLEHSAWALNKSSGYDHAITLELDGHRMLIRTFVGGFGLGMIDCRIDAFLDGQSMTPVGG